MIQSIHHYTTPAWLEVQHFGHQPDSLSARDWQLDQDETKNLGIVRATNAIQHGLTEVTNHGIHF